MNKCPKCGEINFVTVFDGEVIFCDECNFSKCPKCGNRLKEIYDYFAGKTCDGYECQNCDYEKIF